MITLLDTDLLEEATRASAAVAAHDPRSVAATKRLLTSSAFGEARQAIRRELDEMQALQWTPRGAESDPALAPYDASQ